MIFGNQIINGKGTPSIYEDTLANRPPASSIGRLFVQINSPYGIYRDTGTTWVQVSGGGGGGVGNWDQVLGNGGALTQNRSFNFDYDFGLTFLNGDYFKLDGFNQFRIDYRNGVFPYDNYIIFDKTYFKYYTNTNVNTIFSFDYISGDVAFGDFAGVYNSTHINITNSSNQIYFAPQSVMTFLTTADSVVIGDASGTNTLLQLIINRSSENIVTAINGDGQGLLLEDRLSYLGDFYANFYNHHIAISNVTDNFYIRSYIDNANPFIWGGFNIVGYTSEFGTEFVNLKIDSSAETINTFWSGVGDYIGLLLDFASNQYYLGDYNNLTNNGFLQIDAGNREANFNIDLLSITGSVTSTSSGSISAQHLSIYINGTHYKIQLRNP